MHILSIGRRRTSLSAGYYACKRMVFSASYGLKFASSSGYSNYFNTGLWGFCSEAYRKKETLMYKVKQEINGGSISNPLMPGMDYAKKRKRNKKQLIVKQGDVLNLPDLLFTESRDYLVKYNDDQKVKADQLVEKAILLYFVPVCFELSSIEREWATSLVDIYYDLLPNNDFEVIFVAVDDICVNYISPHLQRNPQKYFEEIFSQMPWTAIPFSFIASRKRITRRFGISRVNFYCTISFFLDSKGYPFTDERVRYLDLEDDEIAKQPFLETLLGSPVRNYVISNKEERVPIHTLKVVALYFYEDGLTDDELTIKLKMAYKELAKKQENFEVVLLYLYDTPITLHSTNEESFWKIFKTMPWLALPFKDPNHKKLKRIFDYRNDFNGLEEAPTLIIFGPNGEFVEPCGAEILMNFGIPAYPFTRKRLAKLETEKIKELKMEMLWDSKTVFRVKEDGSKITKSKLEMLWDPVTSVIVKHRLEFLPNFYPLLELIVPNLKVPFYQFAGKRLLIYFEMDKYYKHLPKLQLIKHIYLQNKGTDDGFEVIYIKKSPSDNNHIADMPWLVHYYGEGYSLPTELEDSIFNFQYDDSPKWKQSCLLLAFERDGSIVRKTFFPTFNNMTFPFYAGGLEGEFLDQLNSAFGWCHWDFLSQENQIYKRRQ